MELIMPYDALSDLLDAVKEQLTPEKEVMTDG